MFAVIWLDEALDELDDLTAYVAEWNPVAARDLYSRIDDAASSLSQFPYLGHRGRTPGTRELLAHPNYWIVYRVTLVAVEIVNILHVRREYP